MCLMNFHLATSQFYILILGAVIKSLNFKFFLSFLNFTFSIICFSETWLDNSIFTSTSLYKLPNYVSKHQIRNYHKVSGVSFYNHKSLIFKIRNDLNVSVVKNKLRI